MNSRHKEYMNKTCQKNKTFEVPGCKGLLLTKRSKEFEELFDDSEVLYYESIDDLIQKARKVIKHPHDYDMMRMDGFMRVSNCHKFEHRFEDMMEIINEAG